MKQSLKKLFSLILLLSTAAIFADAAVAPYLEFRSVSRNNVRKLVGTTVYSVYQYDMESFYGTFNITPGYERSFRPNAIARQLFGSSLVSSTPSTGTTTNRCNTSCDSDCNTLVISGPETMNRNATTDWDASNLMLPINWRSSITFKPTLQNIYGDFYLYVGLDEWVKGMYFRLYGPVVNNRTTLNAEETKVAEGSLPYPAGFYGTNETPVSALYTSALNYFSGAALPGMLQNATFQPLQFAKIGADCKKMSKTGFADLRGEFGWNHITEDGHIGLNIQGAAPTGTRPKAEFLFEPQVGNGKHWELGVGFMGGYTLWRCEDDPDKHFDFLVEAGITHMFRAKQKRTFDLKAASGSTNNNNAHSRYMLAQHLRTIPTDPGTDFANMDGAGATANLQFDGTFAPVANISTRDCKVSVGAQADVLAMFTYVVRGFTWDLGYNFWGRSREKIKLSCPDSCNPFPTNWALKGNATVFGTAEQADPFQTPFVRLAATASRATIHNGIANPIDNNTLINTNPNVDSPVAATAIVGGTANQPVSTINTGVQLFTSNPPIRITEDMLDTDGAETRAYTNKVFTNFAYTWKDREDWIPYIGIAAEGEFGNGRSCQSGTTANTDNCPDSLKIGLSKWAVFVKLGVTFD